MLSPKFCIPWSRNITYCIEHYYYDYADQSRYTKLELFPVGKREQVASRCVQIKCNFMLHGISHSYYVGKLLCIII